MGAQVLGILQGSPGDDSALFAPFQSQGIAEVSFSDLPTFLQSLTTQAFTTTDSQLIRASQSRYIAHVENHAERSGSADFTVAMDVWQVESLCRPDSTILWHSLEAEIPANTSELTHAPLQLVIEVPGEVQVGESAFGSALHLSGQHDVTTQRSPAPMRSWSGLYVSPSLTN